MPRIRGGDLQLSAAREPQAADRQDQPGPDTMRLLEHVYRNEALPLTRYFQRRLSRSEDAGDLVQEAFVRLAQAMRQAPLRAPGAYLQRIARNLLFDHSRHARRAAVVRPCPADGLPDPSVPAEQEQNLAAQDLLTVYRQALDRLPERTREIFVLHRLEDMTYRQIGERLGIAIPTVQYHMAQALAHLDEALDR